MPEDTINTPQPDFGAFGVTPPDTTEVPQSTEGPDFAAFGVEPEVELSSGGEEVADVSEKAQRKLSPWEKIFGEPQGTNKPGAGASIYGGGVSPETMEASYENMEQSYVFRAGFNNSLMGMAYDIMEGESMYDKEKLEAYDPSVIEEVGAIALGFLFDAPLFMAGGGLGGSAAKYGLKPLAKGMSKTGSKILRKRLMSSGLTRELADDMIVRGATKNAKLLNSVARNMVPKGQAIGSSVGALSIYNALGETLRQMSDGDIPLSEVEAKDVWHEGVIGAKMGAALGVIGIGGKYLETVMKVPSVHQLISRGAAKGVALAGEVSLFAVGDAFLRDTEADWGNALKMVAGAKLSGMVQHPQKVFTKSKNFDNIERRKDYDAKFNSLESASLEKYRPEWVEGEFTKKLSETDLIKIMGDENITWLTKTKLLYEATGKYPIQVPEVTDVKTIKEENRSGIKVYATDSDGTKILLDARKFDTKGAAEKTAKLIMDEVHDISKRREFDDLSLSDKNKVENAAMDAGMDIGEVVDAWNTRAELRDGKQLKTMRKFYKVWDESMMPIEGEGTVLKEPAPGAPTKKAPVAEPTKKAPVEKAPEITPTEKIKPEKIPTQPQAEALAAKYKEAIDRLKKEDPKKFWSVDRPSDAVIDLAAKEGRLVEVEGGMAITMPDGDMIGLIKTDPLAKGVAKAAQEARIAMGADRLDTYDTTPPDGKTSLVENYKKQGMVEVARVPFDEASAPKDTPLEILEQKPDVVIMAEDKAHMIPEKYLNKRFDSYEEAIKYRDRAIEAKTSGEAFDQFFTDVSAGTKGFSNVKYDPTLKLDDQKHGKFVQSYNKYRGNFDAHIEKSIPGHKEIQVATGDAIIHTIGEGKLLDIGGSENSWAKSITETSEGKIKTVTLDPNDQMESFSKKTPVPGNEYVNAPFMEKYGEKEAWEPKREYDVVHESMTFQFVSDKRAEQIGYIKDKVLKEDGILILEEKFVPEDKADPQWAKNEAKKDEYKKKYFEEAELTKKKEEQLVGMHENMVSTEAFEGTLKDRFDHVARYWASGNFKGYIATNSIGKAASFMDRMGETGKSEFSADAIEFVKGGLDPKGKERTVRGDITKIPGGYRLYDEIHGAEDIMSVEQGDKVIERTQKEIENIDQELTKRDYDKLPEHKYHIFDRTYNDRESFIKDLKKLVGEGALDNEAMLSPDIKLGDVSFGEAAAIFQKAAEFSRERLALNMTSTEELNALRRQAVRRVERVELAQQDLDLPETISEVRSKETEDLLKAAETEFTAYELTDKQKIAKAISEGKKLSAEEAKNIRSMLEGFLKANQKTFDRLKIPVRTRTLRQINNISSGKHGWRQVGNTIKDLTRMISDAKYREEVRAKESYITRLLKEVNPKGYKESTGKGPGKAKAKKSYYNPVSGYNRVERLETINAIINEGLTNPEFREQARMEMQRIEDRGNKRIQDRDRGIETPEGIDQQGFTIEDRVVLEQLEYATIGDKSSGDVRIMLDNIKEMKKDDRMASERQRLAYGIEMERKKDIVKEAATPAGKVMPIGSERKSVGSTHPGMVVGDGSLKSIFSTISSRRKLAPGEKTVIFQDPINKEIMPMVSRSEEGHSRDKTSYQRNRRRMQEEAYKIEGSGIARDRKLSNRSLDDRIQKPDILTIELSPGGEEYKIPLSQMEAGNLWLTLGQEGSRASFVKPKSEGGMGWTDKTFAELEAFISPEIKDLALKLRDEMERYKTDKLQPIYRRENGVSLNNVENYWPYTREAGEFNKSSTGIGETENFKTRVTSDHHIDRSNSTNPFVYMDMMEVYDRYMKDQMHYTNWAEAVRVMDNTFKDPSVRATIGQFHGKRYLEAIDWYTDRFAGHTIQEKWSLLDNSIRRMSKGILYLNRAVGIKQTVSSMMYMVDMDPANWSAGMARMLFTTEGHDLRNYLKEQPFVLDRGHAALDVDHNFIRDRANYSYSENVLKRAGQRLRISLDRAINLIPTQKADQVLSANIKYGDRFPIVNAGGAYVMDLMRRDGTSWKKVNALAERYAKEKGTDKRSELDMIMQPYVEGWTMLSESTQQSTRISNISQWRTGSAMNRAMVMFTSGAGQIHRIASQSFNMSVNSFKQGNYTEGFKHAKNFMVSHVLMGAAFNLISNGILVDPEKKALKNSLLWSMTLGNAAGLARYGRGIGALQSMVLNQPWADKASLTPIFENLKTIAKSAYMATAYHGAGNMDKRNDQLVKLAKGLGQLTGVQAKQAIDIYEDVVKGVIQGESDKPVRTALGIYDPDYNTGLEVIDTFDPDAWEEARRIKAGVKAGVRQGVPGSVVKKNIEKNR